MKNRQTKTLGDWASIAIKTHFQKVTSHEAEVLEDRQPEDLHQMRVGIRRLRSAVVGFAPALYLPKPAQQQKIGKIGHGLGTLRDLDVLKATLEEQYKPSLPLEEQESLETAIADLLNQRQRAFKQVKKTLKHQRYHSLKRSLEKWLKQPNYQHIAQMPILEVLPDLLLPEVSKLLLHPGWLVGTEVKAGEIDLLKNLTPETVEQQLAVQGPLLHSLRKEAKRVRYQMEVFAEFYGTEYEIYLKDVKELQEVLGQIQDSFVLAEFLSTALKSEVKTILPTLASGLTQASYQAWQQWQTIQQRYLNPQTRRAFHLAILQPSLKGVK